MGKVEAEINRLLNNVPSGADVQRFARHLARERSALVAFLYFDATAATNYLDEQALRPAASESKDVGGEHHTI